MKLSQPMIDALKWIKRNHGTNIGPGCPATDATCAALHRRGLLLNNGRYYELNDAGADALADL